MADPREAVKVIVRCRPFNDQERRNVRALAVEVDSRERQVLVRSATEGVKVFTFDQAFGPDSRQEDVYDAACAPLVEAALQGFNATVFAYGQTGCGKTFTMEGRDEPSELRGIIPRAFDHIFREIQKGAGDREFLVRVSHLELYNEEVRDLLSRNTRERLELRESPERGVHVRGLKEFAVKSAQELRAVLEVGAKNRTVGATLMNQDSSRSHSIFTIIIETVDKPCSSSGGSGDGSGGTGMAAGSPGRQPSGLPGSVSPAKARGGIRVGKLNLVDLAGSERQAKTGATGERLKEASKINLSLSALGNVISALTGEGGMGAHVPYRDSKLTRLLQDSLGGSAKTVMVANVGPADYNYEETLSTLRYASRAKSIQNKPRINEDPKDAMLREFQAEISRLKAQLAERQQGRAASAGGTPEKLSMQAAAAPAASEGGAASNGSDNSAADVRAVAIRRSMRAELQQQMRTAASLEALAKARQAIEQQARQRLEAELASRSATVEERQHAEAVLATQQAELQSYAAEVEREERERLALEQRIRAMESKVLRGGENLLDKVQVLEAAAQQGAEALAAQQAARQAAEARIAQLELAASEALGRYSTVQEEVLGKRSKLQRLTAAVTLAQQECASLAAQYQSERERLLDEIRRLGTQMKQKELIIGAYIPPEYQELIMSRCRWEEGAQRWSVDHLEWAGNLVRARREASLSGSQPSSGSCGNGPSSARSAGGSTSFGDADGTAFGMPRGGGSDPGSDAFGLLHGSSERLSDVYFSYAAASPGPSSPNKRPCSGMPGSPLAGGRPRTAALAARQSLQRPVSALGRAWG